MENLYAEFTRQRQYLSNVSPATLEGYHWAWKAFESVLNGKAQVTKTEIVQRIAELRQRGLSPVTVNTYLRSLNAFARWARAEGNDIGLEKIPKLSEPQTVIEAFTDAHVQRLVKHKPRSASEVKAHTLTCLILDTGLRIDEALSLERADVDLDNLLLTIRSGKGRKGRVVPFSLELRKLLYRYMSRHPPRFGNLVLFAGDGVKVSQRNALRDFKALCGKLGIKGVRCSFHTLRHTFASAYIRAGGGEFRLQRILGHTTLEMTRRYVNLQTEDLREFHGKASLLNRRR